MVYSSYEFIELHRTFHEIAKDSPEHDEIDVSQSFRFGESLRWNNLITEYRLIILSEAGSGKTAEIRNVARALMEQGKPAFFLRLEHISTDFEDAFEVGSYEAFNEWLATAEEGWLLLDSVDEARLRNPGDFELAIHKLSRRIRIANDRTHIVITGRTTAWRPKTDLAICTDLLPYAVASKKEYESMTEGDIPDGSFHSEPQINDRSIFKIVALDDLTSDQIGVFVKVRGIQDSKAFLDAVERADAWLFTSRPQDLEELTEFWNDKGRIGSRLEIMQNSIDRRLAEREQNRDDARPLSTERTRQGARLLAATATLAKVSTIRVPDGADNTKGIAVQSVLPDWNSREQSILLSRPIFDEAIYGAVRFHHRSVREYLAAEWFAELLKRETSRRAIETLFFRNQYGTEIVVPTLRPILPWLVLMDEKIRDRVRRIAPEIIFEGGDPAQLPLDVRCDILRTVCEQMADGVTGRSARNYEAVQRFANSDLNDEIRVLIRQYADNDGLTEYLLRLVWLGELTDLLPEAMTVALMPNAEKNTRITAFSAVKAIGSKDDHERVRQSFLTEKPELKREFLAELLKDLQPTEQTLYWLLACIKKIEQKKPFAFDHLSDSVSDFVAAADIQLLPLLVTGFEMLLSSPPMIERGYCEVSENFQWLIVSAGNAVERLILARHIESFEPAALSVLHKFSVLRNFGFGSEDISEVKGELLQLIPSWPELNKALFWFEVQRSRESIDSKAGQRLTDYWVAGAGRALWKFEISDFNYVAEEISRQTLLDDKMVALSLAIDLYKKANQPSAWLFQLYNLVEGNEDLSARLRNYLRPPTESIELRRMKKQHAKWKRLDEANRKKTERYHLGMKKYFHVNLDKARAELLSKPGIITDPLWYLFNQTRKKNTTSKWTDYNWQILIPDYGEDVAQFYRDAVVSFWRNHEPRLRSEGVPINQTPWEVIIGLTGLEIESIEVSSWPKNLSTAEVQLASKYASFELNGFPTWFPNIFEMHSEIVGDFLTQEVWYELSIENPEIDTNYVISDLSYSGQWAWDQLAPSIYKYLETAEPNNLSNLEKLLKIVQGSNISDSLIEELACLKCSLLKDLHHAARWFAVWTSVAPEAAIITLKTRIEEIADTKEQTLFAMIFITCLFGGRFGDLTTSRQAFKTSAHLKSLCLMMNEYIRSQEDIDHSEETGSYSIGLRDAAQDARNNVFNILKMIPGKESFMALIDISKEHPDELTRPWIMLHAKSKAEQEGDIEPWSPSQVRDLNEKLEFTPNNHRELAEFAILRLLDLKDDLEHGDTSVASILKKVSQETEIRKYIGKELRDKAQCRYSIPQEEELADAKKPDLRFLGTSFDGPVPVELKLADNWSGPQLFERLENQLCGDYLRDNRSSRGVFVLVYRGEKSHWEMNDSGFRVDFDGLTVALQEHWKQISPNFSKVDDITIIGIDLTKRAS